MKKITYSIVCEDIAHYHFINEFLGNFSSSHSFILNRNCYYRFKCSTKKQVLNGYADIANQAFRDYSIDLLIVLMDYDDNPPNKYKEFCSARREELFEGIQNKVLIVIPVQSIEHWLRFLQWKTDNPKATKVPIMEKEDRNISKIKIYNSKRPSDEKTIDVIKELVASADRKWLCQRSKSFNHFHSAFQAFIES